MKMEEPDEGYGMDMSTNRLQVTKIAAKDAKTKMAVELFDAYRQFYGQPSDVALASRFIEQRLASGDSVIFLAYTEKGRVRNGVGFMQLYPSFSSVSATRVWILNDLFIDPSARKSGIGTALMAAAEEHARKTGASKIVLETASDNYAAQRLYESQSYRKTAEGEVCHYCFDID